MKLSHRIHGCLLGGACGDALGAPVEFLSRDEIASRYGPDGITLFDAAYGGPGLITDDTQMALFTTEGLIRAIVRYESRGISNPVVVVHRAYRRWLATQDEAFGALSSIEGLDGWLIKEQRLWARRSPGNTCLAALRAKTDFGEPARNDSKGCGTVMRDAPFGFLIPERAFGLAVETAKTTHGHPSARYASGALAIIIARIVKGDDLRRAVEHALATLRGKADAREVSDSLEQALEVSRQSDWRERLPELGDGWVAEEALAIAVLCALAAGDPREAIIAAVNHDGDSDSTGAITGNIVGTLHGPASLPREWTEQVELRDVIETLATDFAAVMEGHADSDELRDRYPG